MHRDQGGPQRDRSLDMQVLEDAIETTEEILAITGKKLTAAQKARGIRLVYEYFMEDDDRSVRDTGKVVRLFRDVV